MESLVVKIHGFFCGKRAFATLAQSGEVRKRSKRPKMKEFKVRRKYYKTALILTFGLSEVSRGQSCCANPLVFNYKTATATFAQSVRFVSNQN